MVAMGTGMMDTADLAWVATVWDIKALLMRKKNSQRSQRTQQIVVTIESRNLKAIRRLCKLTGVRIEIKEAGATANRKNPPRRLCSEHCPEPHAHVKSMWHAMPEVGHWAITGVSAAVIFHNIKPYLENPGPYVEAMDEALANAELTSRGSGVTRKSLVRLINLGWKLPPQLLNRVITEQVGELAQAVVQQEKDEAAPAPAPVTYKIGGNVEESDGILTEVWARLSIDHMQRYLAVHAAQGWEFTGDVMVGDGSRHPVFKAL